MEFKFLCIIFMICATEGRQTPATADTYEKSFYYLPAQAYPAYQIVSAKQQPEAVTTANTTTTEINTNKVAAANAASVAASTTTTEPEINNEIFATNETSTTSIPTSIQASSPLATFELSTDNTIYTPAEFPRDLLEIARTKLGLTSLDEVPSISELTEYLGTGNAEQTINYIRQLTSTAEGITLIKAYLESADFTDRTDELKRRQQNGQQQQTEMPNTNIEDADTPTKLMPNNLLERIAAYFHMYNFWSPINGTAANATRKAVEQQLSKYIKPQLAYRKRMQTIAGGGGGSNQASAPAPLPAPHIPLLIRQPLPYHYPIPLRPMQSNRVGVVMAAHPQPFVYTSVHLNTPKMYVPPHIQLARAANIPPQQLQALLQAKPKLAELAAKVSHLPLDANERSSQMNAQLLAAVKRAVEQDDDLRRLLQSTAETLK